jgi:hypothetical protein
MQPNRRFKRSLLKAFAIYSSALIAALTLGSIAHALDVEPPLPQAAQPMTFSRACEPGLHLTIAAVGDVLPHESLARMPISPTRISKVLRPQESLAEES